MKNTIVTLLILTVCGCSTIASQTQKTDSTAAQDDTGTGIQAEKGTAAGQPSGRTGEAVALSGPEFCRTQFLALAYTIDTASAAEPLSGIELWKTSTGGRLWEIEQLLVPKGGSGRIKLELPDGKWGFIAVPVLKDRRSERPAPGEPPALLVTVDRRPPRIETGSIEVKRTSVDAIPELDTYELTLPYQIEDANPSSEPCIGQIAAGNSGTWHTVERKADMAGVMHFHATSYHSPLLIRIKSQDRAGNVAIRELTIWPEDEVAPPVVRIVAPKQDGCIRGGAQCRIHYRIDWRNAAHKPAALEFSPDGRSWETILENGEAIGRLTWDVPSGSHPDALLRLEASGATGRRIHHTIPIKIDGRAPETLILGPSVLPHTKGSIMVKTHDRRPAASGVEKVVVYARKKGEEERFEAGTADGAATEIPVTLTEAGMYEFWAVAWDHAGNHSESPNDTNAVTIRVKEKNEAITLTTFTGKGVLKAGSTHFIGWKLGNLPSPAVTGRILLVEEAGSTILKAIDPLSGKTLLSLPDKKIRNARLKIEVGTAGQKTIAVQSGLFSTDGIPPAVTISEGSRGTDGITLTYTITDHGPAGLKTAWLYRSPDGGLTWRKETTLDLSGSVTIPAGQGLHSFFIAAEDKAGNRSLMPEKESTPQISFLIGDTPGDVLVLDNFRGGETVRGGSTHFIAWSFRYGTGILIETPVALSCSHDDGETYTTVKDNLPATGRYAFTFPEEHTARLRFKLTALCTNGTVFTCGSVRDIEVDAEPPTLLIAGPAVSNSRETAVVLESADDRVSTLAELYLYGRKNSMQPWKKLPHRYDDNKLHVLLSDGTWQLYAGGKDRTGNRNRAPGIDDQGFQLTVDTVPPTLIGTRSPATATVATGTLVTYRFEYHDTNPAPFSLSVRMRLDNAPWKEIKNYLPLNVPCHIEAPQKEGVLQLAFKAEDLTGNTNTWTDMINIARPKPEISLTLPKKDSYAGGKPVHISWHTKNAGKNATVSMSFSVDDKKTWKPLENAQSLDIKGEKTFSLPKINSRRTYIKAEITCAAAEKKSAAIAGPFSVSSIPPEGYILNKRLILQQK